MITFTQVIVLMTIFLGLFTGIYFLLTLDQNKDKIKTKLKEYFELPAVTVIVPAYNEENTVAKTLNSLLNLDYPKDRLTLMVVDDGSKDKTLEVLKIFEERGVIVHTKENGGKGSAINYGIDRCKTDFIGVLDADSWVDDQSLKRLVSLFNKQDVMAVTPSMMIGDVKGFLKGLQSIEFLVVVFIRKTLSFLGSIHITPGPFTIFRKKFFEKHGKFDRETITEDIEMALRIQSNGYVIENAVDAYVYTTGISKFWPLFKQRIRWFRGFIDNVLKYKHIIDRKYGNLGLFILPAAFIAVGLTVLTVIITLFNLFKQSYTYFLKWYYINFDITSLLSFKFDIFFLNIDSMLILTLIGLAISITIICISKGLGNEKQKIKISYLYYLVAYWLFFSAWWIVAICYKVTNRKIKWGSRYL